MGKTYLDLYRLVAAKNQDFGALELQFDLTADEAEAAVNQLRKADVLQSVSVILQGSRYVALADGLKDEKTALERMKAAGIDPGAPLK